MVHMLHQKLLRGLCGCGDGSLVVVMGVGWSVCFVSWGRASRIIRDAYLSLVSAVWQDTCEQQFCAWFMVVKSR